MSYIHIIISVDYHASITTQTFTKIHSHSSPFIRWFNSCTRTTNLVQPPHTKSNTTHIQCMYMCAARIFLHAHVTLQVSCVLRGCSKLRNCAQAHHDLRHFGILSTFALGFAFVCDSFFRCSESYNHHCFFCCTGGASCDIVPKHITISENLNCSFRCLDFNFWLWLILFIESRFY